MIHKYVLYYHNDHSPSTVANCVLSLDLERFAAQMWGILKDCGEGGIFSRHIRNTLMFLAHGLKIMRLLQLI